MKRILFSLLVGLFLVPTVKADGYDDWYASIGEFKLWKHYTYSCRGLASLGDQELEYVLTALANRYTAETGTKLDESDRQRLVARTEALCSKKRFNHTLEEIYAKITSY